mgnify:CR=1 FL=1
MTLKINTMDSLENKNLSREGIIVRLAELNLQEEPVERTELDSLKQNFYKLRIAEVETARKAFEEANGTTEGFVPEKDEYEERFKEIMSAIREKRNALKEEEEQEKLANLEKKKAINDAKDEISDMAMAIAEKVVGRELNAQDQDKLFDEFIDELGDGV